MAANSQSLCTCANGIGGIPTCFPGTIPNLLLRNKMGRPLETQITDDGS
jgi:hypothetical protein